MRRYRIGDGPNVAWMGKNVGVVSLDLVHEEIHICYFTIKRSLTLNSLGFPGR
jgi:hypothetical protein